jgi:hypothetical protein
MKTLTSELLTVGAWSLHLGSFIMASMPYLQALSLILAITVSVFTLHKMFKNSQRKRKEKNDKIY